MFASVSSIGLVGIEAFLVNVEVDFRRGLPGFDIVGLPDTSVKESRDRVKAVLQNLGYPFPNAKIVANLAPAERRKVGSVYDLPLFVSLLNASGYEKLDIPAGTAMIGELGLDGVLRSVKGVLPMAIDAGKLGISKIIIPQENAAEASVVKDAEILCAGHVREVVDYLKDGKPLLKASDMPQDFINEEVYLDLSDVKGQHEAKRAMEIAAAGSHNLLFIGAPGTGKSMLAKRLPGILPDMSEAESIETTKIYSVAGLLGSKASLIKTRPFRAPHHTVSPAALTGGGSNPRPGDLSLAHNGVLFLDELPEFLKNSLEVLRQPLEDGYVSISRVMQRITYPASVMLAVAMNPCPCGYFGHPTRECKCSPNAVQKYLNKVSGPLLDRIDLHIEVSPIDYSQISSKEKSESSRTVKERVKQAHEIQKLRFSSKNYSYNAHIPAADLSTMCVMDEKASMLLKSAFDRLSLSARAYSRILKVARTIADLHGSEIIGPKHIAEAIQFRSLDRKYWG